MNEQPLTIEFEDSEIPCSLYAAANPLGVVLLGHGLSVDRFHETVTRPARMLHESGFSVLVPELPLHGERASESLDWDEFISSWQKFWAGDGRESLLQEWREILSYARRTFELPVAYFGLSLGTQYGIPLLSSTRGISAAVLGLFGSEALPKSKILNLYAPQVSTPVYFVQKLDDEIHSVESSRHLFDSLGPRVKILDATRGKHSEVGYDSMRKACKFLADRVDA